MQVFIYKLTMRDFIRRKLTEGLLKEKLMLKDWDLYIKLVADAYADAEDFDGSAVGAWKALNESNYTLFDRLLSKTKVVFITSNKANVGSIDINGKKFDVKLIEEGDEYNTQSEMKASFNETGILKISMDYSQHPILSVKDNIVFRTVHDYIAHILGNHDFGAKGEIACYNLHAKMAPNAAIPALFTEVVGQASTTIVTGSYPKQKIAILKGFDFNKVGLVDDENYTIVDKVLVPKSEMNKPLPSKPKNRVEPSVVPQQKMEPELTESLGKIDTSKIKIKVTNVNGLTVFIPFYDKDRMGAFRTKPFNDGFKIDSTLLYDRYQNKGIGKGMYRYIINYFKKQGKILYSDDAQSPDAKRVWDSLVGLGLAIKNNNTYQSN